MRWSAARLRWLLLGGVLLLAGVVAGFFGLARYRAGKIWQRILARNGVNLRQETNGFTYSQSSGGRTVFTLHAAKATPLGKNKWALHDAVLILYGRQPGRDDRISGNEIEYDQDQGVARAVGEVHMDLQVPAPGGKAQVGASRPGLGFAPEQNEAQEAAGASGRSDSGLIHVRTSGLVYMRKMGLAATGEAAEFRYGGMTCTSRGAEFDTGQSIVRLLADVRMTGTVRNAPFSLTAGHAELNRGANAVDVVSPVWTSGGRSARAAHAVAHLRKDGSLEAGEANGGVELRDGLRTVGAPQMTAVFGQENRPQQARLFSGVTFADASKAAPAQGSAGAMELRWAADGVLQTANATGSVRFAETGTGKDGAPVSRQMRAEQAVANFGESGGVGAGAGVAGAKKAVLQRVHLSGGAELGSRTGAQGGKGAATSDVSGDDIVASFVAGADGRAVVQTMDANGHTRLEQTAADGGRQQSTGDVLLASFVPDIEGRVGAVQVSSAVQTGRVEIESWPAPAKGGQAGGSPATDVTRGHAAKAVYVASDGTVTLSGGNAEGRAVVDEVQGQFAAPSIVMHQGTGDAEASGGVVATEVGSAGQAATHVIATRARLLHEANVTEFSGEAGRPVQLFQGGSQVQAGQITFDGATRGMAARPGQPGELIEAVFAAEPGKGSARRKEADAGKGAEAFGVQGGSGVVQGGVTAAGQSAVRVSAARMDYDDAHREAVFTGDVRMRGVMGEVRSERGSAFLNGGLGKSAPTAANRPWGKIGVGAPDLGGSLERMVMLGGVRITQPGRTGVGEQLTYTAATDTIALTGAPGKPPRVTAEQGSVVTGATLVFRSTDSTIVVAGTEGGPKAGGTRVHTETDLKTH